MSTQLLPPARKAVVEVAGQIGELSRALSAIDKDRDRVKVIDALLERFYQHRTDWVSPYLGRESKNYPDQPAFKPTWWNLDAAASDDLYLSFSRGADEIVRVPVAFFRDPEGWIERDRASRVSPDTWYRTKDAALGTWKDDQWEKVAEQLRKQGFTVTKEGTA